MRTELRHFSFLYNSNINTCEPNYCVNLKEDVQISNTIMQDALLNVFAIRIGFILHFVVYTLVLALMRIDLIDATTLNCSLITEYIQRLHNYCYVHIFFISTYKL